jgi:hypothetical protein
MENKASANGNKDTCSSVNVNCKILTSYTKSITSNSKQPCFTLINETSKSISTVRNMEAVSCRICDSNQVVEDYFAHLQIHLEEMNQLCEILQSSRKNNQIIDWSVIDIHCPSCKKIMVYMLPDTNSQYARAKKIHNIERHVRKCCWRIVSERQRIHFISKAKGKYKSSVKRPNKFSKYNYSIEEGKYSFKQKANHKSILCSDCGRMFALNISLKRHKCNTPAAHLKLKKNVMVRIYPENFDDVHDIKKELDEDRLKIPTFVSETSFRDVRKSGSNDYFDSVDSDLRGEYFPSETSYRSSSHTNKKLHTSGSVQSSVQYITNNTSSMMATISASNDNQFNKVLDKNDEEPSIEPSLVRKRVSSKVMTLDSSNVKTKPMHSTSLSHRMQDDKIHVDRQC